MEIIKCPNCGGDVLSTSDTCFRCGYKLPKNVEQPKPTQSSYYGYDKPNNPKEITQEKDFVTPTHVDDVQVKFTVNDKILKVLSIIVWTIITVLLISKFLSYVDLVHLPTANISPIITIVLVVFAVVLWSIDKLSHTAVKVDLNAPFLKDKKIIMVIEYVVDDDLSYYALGKIKDCSVRNGDSVSIYSKEGLIDGNALAQYVTSVVEVDGESDIRNDEAHPGEYGSVGLRTNIIIRKGMVLVKN